MKVVICNATVPYQYSISLKNVAEAESSDNNLGDHWALVNLILMLCSALGMIKFEDKKKYNVFNIMFAVASILVFVFTENTFLPMALVDKYTLFMIALFIGEALSHLLMFKKKQENKEEA